MSERCETDKTPQAKANATDKFNSIARHNQRHCLFDNAATTNQAIFSAIFNSLLDLRSGVWTLPETKSDEIQIALLPEQLIELLVEWKKYANSIYIFPSPSKSGYVEEIKGAWAKVRKESGLHHLQARDLRRTFISWSQEAGVPIAAVQAQVGHADIATTAKHYTVFSESEKRKGLRKTVTSMIAAAE